MTVSAAGDHVITAADPPDDLHAALNKINSARLGAGTSLIKVGSYTVVTGDRVIHNPGQNATPDKLSGG